jgi:kynureninase
MGGVVTPESLYRAPNALAPHYSRFAVADRMLLTGHSHQAWPDCGYRGQQRAWEDAANLVDEKWEAAFERAEQVRRGYARLLDDPDGHGAIALGVNTHELVVRFLSALPLRERPRLVTTNGEFHTIRRQLDRLAEEGIEVVRVERDSATTVAERLAAAVDGRTAAVLASSVFYRDARIVRGLGAVMAACAQNGAELLVDAYHQLNVVPFSLGEEGLEGAFVVGGGYKYCQLGEGNAFLRVPPEAMRLRPVVTGWFSEFSALAEGVDAGGAGATDMGERGRDGGDGAESGNRGTAGAGVTTAGNRGTAGGGGADSGNRGAAGAAGGSLRVLYGAGGDRFAGATYDPASHYRAAEVFGFFHAMRLTPALLREVNRHQVELLARGFDALDLDPRRIDRDRSAELSEFGGFLALRTPHAAALHGALRARNVLTDYRGDTLRLGPAPYLSDEQLRSAVGLLGESVRGLPG